MNQVFLDTRAIVRILAVVALVLVLASIAGQLSKYLLGHDQVKGLVPLFYLDKERNVPTYFSVLLLLFAALLLAVIALVVGKQRAPYVSKWGILSLTFLFLAFDEAFQVHERLIVPFRGLLGGSDLGIFYYAWVVPGIAFVAVLGVFFSRFVLALPAATRFRFVLAGALYVGGALGVEFVGGWYAETHSTQTFAYSMIATTEESLEMAGLIVFIWALLQHCAEHFGEVRLRFHG